MFRTARNTISGHKEKKRIPKRVQNLIPIRQVFTDGIFLSGSVYSKTWRITDINYRVASNEDKTDMNGKYQALLNSLDAGTTAKITINNRRINRDSFEKDILLAMAGDGLDHYRQEYNEVIVEKAMYANNSIIQEKYITLSAVKKTFEEATAFFARAGSELVAHLAALGSVATELNANERLRVLHDFFRSDDAGFEYNHKESEKRKHSFKDAIAPDSYLAVDGKTIKLGDKYARTIFLRDYASQINDKLINELCDLPRCMMLSIDILPIPTDEALKEIEMRVMSVDTNITSWQRSQNKFGNFSALPPPNMENDRTDVREAYEDITVRNQRMFFGFVSIIQLADSKAQLDSDTESLLSIGSKCTCQLAPMTFRQIEGMQTALPFGVIRIEEESFRTLNTQSLAILNPFKAQEIRHSGGCYYGVNATSGNLIVIDREKLMNGNGFIFGVSGSGKSFIAKQEAIVKVLSTGDDVVILDPESEYGRMVQSMHGEVIRIAGDSSHHINALDMSSEYSDTLNPIALKSEFIISLFQLVSGHGQMDPRQKSIIDRCLDNVYKPYIMSNYTAEPPTLKDLYDELSAQDEQLAKDAALVLELFTIGSLNIFAHQTNVNTQSRLVCYDIRNLGNQLKTVGMLVVLDSIYNRITRNRAQGRRTWILIDEIYVLFSSEYSSNYLHELWKRTRKYGGFCTGITQNVTDMLQSNNARTMLANSEFLILLNQAATDRIELANLLNISADQMNHIENAAAGRGLIRCGANIVPFANQFPRDTELYRLMNTKIES